MRTVLVFAAAAIVSALFLSCGPKEPDMTALKKTVDEFNSASKEALMGGDIQKNLAFFDDNATEMPPNMPMIKGKDAIKTFYEQMMKSGMKMTSVEFNVIDVQASGTMAYSIGTYDMSMSVGKTGGMKDNGKLVDIWKQQTDGTWKVTAETWNTDKPLPVVEKPKTKKAEAKHKMTSKKKTSTKKAATKKTPAKKKTTKKSSSSK
jgi:uncharacterized protein (TIGR02246 family)